MTASGSRILLVEDDADLAAGLSDALELEGYYLTHTPNGHLGLIEALKGGYDLVILDAMLPELSGFDVLKQLRARGNPVPVLMLTAKSQEVDKVRGLRLGADDYVTKPFGIMELLARVEARVRRGGTRARALAKLEVKDVLVDFSARKAWLRRRLVALTAREFEILETLMERRGEAVSRAELINRIWGTSEDVEVSTRTVDQHVTALRRKLGDKGEGRLIETVYGYGYRLAG